MKIKSISDVTKWEARRKFLEYRRAVRERHNEEDDLIMRGYRQLSLGRMVIDAHQAIREAGVDHRNYPKLAICRADAKMCWYERPSWAAPRFAMHANTSRHETRRYITLPIESLPALPNNTYQIRAIVPTIPPALRPKGALSNYHILWEADWERAPVDPILLRHIGGPIYVVLAQWDLTELERSVLSARASN